MNIRLKDRTILHGDLQNDTPIGEFNDVLNSDAIAEFEIEHSFGTQVLKILQNMNSSSDYKSYVMNYNVLENIYIDFQTAIYNAHRNIKRQEGN